MEVDGEDSSDQMSDSSNDEENNAELAAKIAELEVKLGENVMDYSAHVELISELRSQFDFDKLRLARKRMSEYFPLASNLWMEWLEDEIKIATTSEEKEEVVALFEKAVRDYLSVDVWLEYVQFSIGLYGDEYDKVRNVFERALTAGGLHVAKGALLWEAFIEFEIVVLSVMQGQKTAAADAVDGQLKRIANLFRRQLSCPLLDMEETYERFNLWLDDNVKTGEIIIDKSLVDATFKKSKEKLDKIRGFEENLLLDMACYEEYLAYEKSKDGTPGRVLCLYERVLCDQCLNPTLWFDYIDFVDTVLKDGKLVVDVARRGIRNCPWSGLLTVSLMRMLEKYDALHTDINGVVESALASGLHSATDVRDVWLSYLEYMRRRSDAPGISIEEEQKRVQEMSASFERAAEFVNALEGADLDCLVMQFWARVEAKITKNMEKFRTIWSEILNFHAGSAAMWLEYINLEMAYGDSKHLRKLFPRALQKVNDWPENIYSAWLNFERDEGTLESLMECMKKCTARLGEIEKQRKEMAVEAEPESRNDRRGKRKMEKKPVERKRPLMEEKKGAKGEVGSPEKRRKTAEEETTKDIVDQLLSEPKHGVTVKHDSSKDNRTVFVSNLDFATSDETLRGIFEKDGVITDLRLVKDFKGRSKGYSYVEFQNTDMAAKALRRDRQLIEGRPMFVSKCDPDRETRTAGFRFATTVEKNKLFVRGLPFTTTETDLRELFGQYGAVKDVRLVVFRNGHSKGLAYVDFHDEISAAQAVLKADGMKIEDKEISVAISNPPGRQKPDPVSSLGGGKKETGPRGRGRTQISFLPRSVQVNPPQ